MKYTRSHRSLGINADEFTIANLLEKYLSDDGSPGENRNLIADLYRGFGQSGKQESRDTYISPINGFRTQDTFKWVRKRNPDLFDRCEGIVRTYLRMLREKRAERKRGNRKTLTQLYLEGAAVRMINNGDAREFYSRGNIAHMTRKLREWRPKSLDQLAITVATHSSHHDFIYSATSDTKFIYTPHIGKMRGDAAIRTGDAYVPNVVSDRFIFDYMLHGKPYVPSLICDGDVIAVRFIEDSTFKLHDGFLAKVGSEFSCAATERDALKGAKMRAVRKTKKALGLV